MVWAVILSIVAHINYAGNDLSGAIGARRMSPYKMSLLAWVMGAMLFILAAPFLFRNQLYLYPFLVNLLLSTLIAVAYPLFLITVQKGNPTVNGVVAGIFPLWTVILSVIFYGDTLSRWQIFALGLIFPGIILSALHLTRKTRLHNLFNKYSMLAILVSFIWGGVFTFFRYPVEAYGWFEASLIQQVWGAIISLVWLFPKVNSSLRQLFSKKNLRWPTVNGVTAFLSMAAYANCWFVSWLVCSCFL